MGASSQAQAYHGSGQCLRHACVASGSVYTAAGLVQSRLHQFCMCRLARHGFSWNKTLTEAEDPSWSLPGSHPSACASGGAIAKCSWLCIRLQVLEWAIELSAVERAHHRGWIRDVGREAGCRDEHAHAPLCRMGQGIWNC